MGNFKKVVECFKLFLLEWKCWIGTCNNLATVDVEETLFSDIVEGTDILYGMK